MLRRCDCQLLLNTTRPAAGPPSRACWGPRSGDGGWRSACRSPRSVRPLSRAFLSSVEKGRITPSLPSLVIIARRLNSTGASDPRLGRDPTGGRRRRWRRRRSDDRTLRPTGRWPAGSARGCGKRDAGRPDAGPTRRRALHEGVRQRPRERPGQAVHGGAQLLRRAPPGAGRAPVVGSRARVDAARGGPAAGGGRLAPGNRRLLRAARGALRTFAPSSSLGSPKVSRGSATGRRRSSGIGGRAAVPVARAPAEAAWATYWQASGLYEIEQGDQATALLTRLLDEIAAGLTSSPICPSGP